MTSTSTTVNNRPSPPSTSEQDSSAKATGLSAAIQRRSAIIRTLSILAIVVALFIIVRALPVDRAIDLLKTKVDDLGPYGPIAYGLAYIIAALLFVPGSAMTLAAAALFGLGWGTVTVSLASTTAAALAFLIARYVARDKVARQAQRFPKFQAIDGAIGQGGWKIIAMLRLSPAMPFSLGNYLFGLTAIRFWPYVLSSWVFMLPGTFMYVYLGHISTEGIRSAAGAKQGKTPAEWALMGVGLVATVAVSVYVAKLSKKALKERTQIEEQEMTNKTSEESQSNRATGWPWATTILAFAAIATISAAAGTYQNRGALQNLFGPVAVTLKETYQPKPDGPHFDHGKFDALLRKYVDCDGWVDYEGFKAQSASLDAYITAIGGASFNDFGRNEKLAFLINAYNAFTIRLILDNDPLDSIKDIPATKRWNAVRWRIGTMTLSLNQIEHEQIRPKFSEPRIHFALVCAAIGCPKLRNEAYAADRLEAQLDDQTRYIHSHDRWFRYQPGASEVHLTKLYKWYGSDFAQVAGTPQDFAARYSPPLKTRLKKEKKLKVRWLDYDWKLNDKKNRR